MRGRTLTNAFIILDEAQNTTPVQMKMFLTRLGREQPHGHHRRPLADRPAARRALRACARRSILADMEGVSFVQFTAADVVRHPLVTRIVRGL